MEELLRNFVSHLEGNINKDIAWEVQDYVDYVFQPGRSLDYDEVEHNIKRIIADYLEVNSGSGGRNINQIATNLYNAYIENDDANLIQAVKTFFNFYSKFRQMKIRSCLYKWRIWLLHSDEHKLEENYNSYSISNKREKNENMPISIEHYKNKQGSTNMNKNTNKLPQNNNRMDVFNKLYMNSYKKQDEKLLNDEIKRLAEMDECTFQPKVKKNKLK